MRREPISPELFAGICAALGSIVAYFLLHRIAPELVVRAVVTTAIGTFGACWLLWWRASAWIQLKGPFAGAVIGSCAAPLAKLASLVLWLACSALGQVTGVIPDPGFDLAEGVVGALRATLAALLVAGPVTIPAGTLLGWLGARPFGKR